MGNALKKRINKDELLIKMVNILKYQPAGLWIREIARQCNVHPEQVRRVILTHKEIFEEYADLTKYNINLKFVRLRKGYERYYLGIIKKSLR